MKTLKNNALQLLFFVFLALLAAYAVHLDNKIMRIQGDIVKVIEDAKDLKITLEPLL